MMVPSKSLIAGLALAAMGTVGNAQTQADKVQVNSIGNVSIEMATGEMVRGQSADKSAGLSSTFVNTDTSGFYGIGAVNNTVTVYDFAYEDTGAAILAGAVPEPSETAAVAAVLLAGGAAHYRRRRASALA